MHHERPLIVSPGAVAQGDPVMLLANPDAVAEAMPPAGSPKATTTKNTAAKNPAAKPGAKEPATEETSERVPVASVDFYHDKNGNGKFDPDADELLASDTDGSDGWVTQVSTAGYAPAGTPTSPCPTARRPKRPQAAAKSPSRRPGRRRANRSSVGAR